MQTVESSFLQKSAMTLPQTLAVQMVNSSDIYTYLNVPQSVYDGLMAAESKGAYYVRNIKGQFETDKVGKARPPCSTHVKWGMVTGCCNNGREEVLMP